MCGGEQGHSAAGEDQAATAGGQGGTAAAGPTALGESHLQNTGSEGGSGSEGLCIAGSRTSLQRRARVVPREWSNNFSRKKGRTVFLT